MTLLVQAYLRAGGTPETLRAEHGVIAKPPHNGKVSFVYDQLANNRGDSLAVQCRGLVLREGTWDVVAYPFNRFFNHGEDPFAAAIDWGTAGFEDKLDGTLVIAYWDDVPGRWLCATRSMCEAHGDINGEGTFAELADRAARAACPGCDTDFDGLLRSHMADRGVTYMFELTGPFNRIVCGYDELGLTLLGARRLSDFRELDVTGPDGLGFKTPRRWEFSSIEHLTEVIRDWDPAQYEGVIVKDAAFNRIKVKAPKYLAAAHLTDSVGSSWRSCLDLVRAGHDGDVIHLAPPAIKERIEKMRGALAGVVLRAEGEFERLKGIDDMKTFALAAQKTNWSAPLFAMKRGKSESVGAFAAQCPIDNLLEMCMGEMGGAP